MYLSVCAFLKDEKGTGVGAREMICVHKCVHLDKLLSLPEVRFGDIMPITQDRWEDFMKWCISNPCGLLSFLPHSCLLPRLRLLLGFLLLLMSPTLFPVLPILADTKFPDPETGTQG